GTEVELFQERLNTAFAHEHCGDAALGYLAVAVDTMLNYGNRSCRWDSVTGRVRSIFDRHDFAFVASYGEMAPLMPGLGYEWAVEKTSGCIKELIELTRPDLTAARSLTKGLQFDDVAEITPPKVTITCQSGDSLTHI